MFNERDYNRNPNNSGQNSQNSYWNRHSVVFHLIVINAVVFFLSHLSGSYELRDFGCLNGRLPLQIWRLFTYQFLHSDFWHVFWNMYSLWLFGRMVEKPLGRKRFLTLYLVSGLIGGACYLLANWGEVGTCVGASGATFGVMVAAAMAFPKAQFVLIFPPVPIRLWVMVLIFVGLEVLNASSGQNSGIAHLAHLGGALGGFLFMRRLAAKHGSHYGDSQGYNRYQQTPPRNPPPPPPPPRSSKPFVFNQDKLNTILDKMSRQGYDQLDFEERDYLRNCSEELKRRRQQQ